MKNDEMYIRPATQSDLSAIRLLFRDTILATNRKDYTENQLNAWASGWHNEDRWLEKFYSQQFFIVQQGNEILGFGSLENNGYLDYLYVHKDHQRKGIASLLYNAIEKRAALLGLSRITVNTSLTAKPFFAKWGFSEMAIQTVTVNGIDLVNISMEKFIIFQA
jgi:putative acetyltransferase